MYFLSLAAGGGHLLIADVNYIKGAINQQTWDNSKKKAS